MEENQTIIAIPQEFKRLFDLDWRESAIYGGRYSLKSHTVARVLLIRARQGKIRVGCFREFQNSIAESSHQLLSDLIKQFNLNDFKITDKTIVNKITGSDFIFKGLWNNEQTIKSIEGIDIAWVEEAQAISNESIEVLTPTVRKPGSQIIYTYNRMMEDDPVHNRLVIEGRPNTLVINVNYDIAIKHGMMPKVILDEINDDKERRPALYKHKWLGEPASSERKIYKDWQVIDKVPHHARLVARWLDFGYTNDPTSIGDVYYYDGGYILDEQLYQTGMLNKPIADFLRLLPNPQTLVIADSAEPKSIDEIKLEGINIIGVSKRASETSNDSFVKWSIGIVQDQRISVTKRSINTLKEYRNYLWFIDKDGKILNEEDPKCANHSMAGVRYVLCTIVSKPPVTTFKPIQPVSNYYPELGI
jgi:PBSX family phage terminase large subunit